MRGSRTIRTAKNRAAILRELAAGWSVHGATRRAGIGYVSYYDWRNADPTFKQETEAAIEAATDHLEDVARSRAIEHSDLLLIFLLRSRRPHIYNRSTRLAIGGDLAAPPVNLTVDDVVHIVMPANFRDQPEVLDEPATIEGEAVSEDAEAA